MSVRIVIVDDHEIVREGIQTLIAKSRPEWQICGEGNNGQEAIEKVRVLKPDVIILDITMPGMSGLEAATKIAELSLPTRILLFTMHSADRLYYEAQAAAAHGVVLKSQAARDLIRAIDCLLAGGTFFGLEKLPDARKGAVSSPSSECKNVRVVMRFRQRNRSSSSKKVKKNLLPALMKDRGMSRRRSAGKFS